MEPQSAGNEVESVSKRAAGVDIHQRDEVHDILELNRGATPHICSTTVNAVDNLNLDLRNSSNSECNGRINIQEPCVIRGVEGNVDGLAIKKRLGVHWKFLSKNELLSLSVTNLGCLLEKLHAEVEEVSSKLVSALQERHRLQDEVDIRFIAIEQLLKVPEKLMCRTTEPPPLPPQISARLNGLPQTDIDAMECQ